MAQVIAKPKPEYVLTATVIQEIETVILDETAPDVIAAIQQDLKTMTPPEIERAYRRSFPQRVAGIARIRTLAEYLARRQ